MNPVEEASTAAAAPVMACYSRRNGYRRWKLKINLARLDTRLLHGQVATAWHLIQKPIGSLLLQILLAKDELRKELIEQAAPMVRKQTLSQFKITTPARDPRFGNTHALILFETLKMLAPSKETPIKTLNVGSMAH